MKRFLTVYENVLVGLEQKFSGEKSSWEPEGTREWPKRNFDALKKWIEKDGFRFEGGHLTAIGKSIDVTDFSDAAMKFDVPHLQQQIERARNAVEDDPGLAIGTAKEIVETTCKTILTERGIAYSHDEKIPHLVKMTREVLKLLLDDIPDSAKGAETIKRVLGSLGTAAQGIAEMRSLFGTGHGREGKAKGLSPRHARLAVGCAATLSMFLLETHEERQSP